MDIARVDSLALLFVIVAAFVARHRDSHASAVAVAAALCCAFFTKQTALVFAAPVLLSMCVTSFRRGLVAVVAFVLLTGALCLWMDRSTGGWFTYYVFEVPRHHGLRTSAWRQILVDSFGKPQLVPLLLTGSILSEARALRAPLSAVLLYGGLVFAGFVGSYSSLLHDDGFANVLLPYYAFVALGAALGLGQAIRLVDEGVSRSPVRERLGVLTIVAVLLHLGVSTYSSRNAIPRGRDVVAGDRMRETLRALPGPVLLLGSGFYGAMAGHPDIHAHTMALVDVLKTGDPARQASLTKDVVDGIRNRSFGAIIRDDSYAMLPAEVSAALASSYRLQGPVFTEAEADAMWPKTGYHSRPGEIWLR